MSPPPYSEEEPAAAPAGPPPLLVWEELRACDGLRAEVARLKDRIARLPPHSGRRVALQDRLTRKVAELLAAETRIGRRR